MKKSKIFLGVTAFALAIAGALGTKASNRFATITGYSLASGGGCGASYIVSCTSSSVAKCKINNKTLYTKGTVLNPCFKLIKTGN